MIAALVYPHQLFAHRAWMQPATRVYIVEDPLFFTQLSFHRQKLMLHRASMRWYADQLRSELPEVVYVSAAELKHTREIVDRLVIDGVTQCRVVDPIDDYLTRFLENACSRSKIELQMVEDPHFLTPKSRIEEHVRNKEKLFFTQFYIEQRKRLSVLLDAHGKPEGGKWSFDTENRRKLPADVEPPDWDRPQVDDYATEAQRYVRSQFPNAPGDDLPLLYPHTQRQAAAHVRQFVHERLERFGDYEDAISTRSPFVYHSVLTPALNIGLVSPSDVVETAIEQKDSVPMNALEGFVRQVIGWREYMRLVYETLGRSQRTSNYWGHRQDVPSSMLQATTGIDPLDHTLRTVRRYGYCHHIERLMVLGNFMLLTEMHPSAVYRWFMEMFIDAYDWVMVPNVYGMSQYADGGRITTKPYISGSSYILKMSDHRKGPWCAVWDALYWRFIDKHRAFFESNPRMRVMTGQLDRMGEKRTHHIRVAETFLESFHGTK